MHDCRRTRRARKVLLPLLAAAVAGVAEANSIEVTRSAALGRSAFGLQLRLSDPARTLPTAAWVTVGPDTGIRDETLVRGTFLIDLSRLRMSPVSGLNRLDLLWLRQDLGATATPVVLFVERGRGGRWLLGAQLWDDATGRLAMGGRAPLQAVPTRIDFEWEAASAPGVADGSFRLFGASLEPGAARTLMFERTDLDNGTQALSHVQLGVVDKGRHFRGTFGAVRLDDFAVYRVNDVP